MCAARRPPSLELIRPQNSAAGDFAEVAYEIIRERSGYSEDQGRFSIDAINDILDELARSKKPEQHAKIRELVNKMPASEHRWLIRIILKGAPIQPDRD